MKDLLTASEVIVYTDGSCHTQKRMGAWVAILLYENREIVIRGNEADTTHNRMELTAVIKAVEYVSANFGKVHIQVFTDSQYVMGLPSRAEKLMADNFVTKDGKELRNVDLLRQMLMLFKNHSIHLNKVRAHQKKNDTMNYNIIADKISRSLTRTAVKEERFLPSAKE
ncbi:MAG: rnhA 2 [Ferruginibacter sp.]|nr:rnhA 2 [Ferruginibacter sp.]